MTARDITEDTVTDAVVQSLSATRDARLRDCLTVLVRHLHAAVRELEPTIAEWETVVEFLTATGQACTPVRQEFVLLSDVLGISSLVQNINHRKAAGATEATVLGPFHMTESPRRELGDSIDGIGRVRRPAARHAAAWQRARAVHHRPARGIPFPHRGPGLLPDSHRRPGRDAA